jgi:uncharacterized protein (TIGR02246 family)
MKTWIPVVMFLAVALVASAGQSALAPRDAEAIRGLMEHFRTAWLANDADGVRGSFTEDAVLMPHHGLEPVVGMKAINEFWFPETTAKTTITKFAQTIDETGGEGSTAFVRGHSEVAWTVEDKGSTEKWRTHGGYVALFKKQANGKWLITHLMWEDVPNQRVK